MQAVVIAIGILIMAGTLGWATIPALGVILLIGAFGVLVYELSAKENAKWETIRNREEMDRIRRRQEQKEREEKKPKKEI